MTHRAFVQSLVTIATLTVGFALWPERKPSDSQGSPTTRTPSSKAELIARTQTPAHQASPDRRLSPRFDRQPADNPVAMQIPAAQVLALVNQTPIQLRDLMPLGAHEIEQALLPELYTHRLQRAIEVELIHQAARTQGVELTEVQKQRVAQVAARHALELERHRETGLSWSTSSPAQVEFERRLLAAQLVEQNLLARQAGVSPSPDTERKADYERGRRALLDRLLAQAQITQPWEGF